MPALIPELEQALNHAPEEPVGSNTPHREDASGGRHRRVSSRESGYRQAQLAAILEGRDNIESSTVAPRKRIERSSRGPPAVSQSSKRRRSPSVPTRKSPRLEKQVENLGNSETESHQPGLHRAAVLDNGNKSAENRKEKDKEKSTVEVNCDESSLQCSTCQFKAKSKSSFDKHMSSRNHKHKVALEEMTPAEVESGTLSKVVGKAGKTVGSLQHSSTGEKSKCGKIVSQEENGSVRTSNSSTGATVSQDNIAVEVVFEKSNCGALGAAVGSVSTSNRLNTCRASAREARTLCASMLKE